jgi:hypothetical protein
VIDLLCHGCVELILPSRPHHFYCVIIKKIPLPACVFSSGCELPVVCRTFGCCLHRFVRNKSETESTRAAVKIQQAFRRCRAAALVRGVGSSLAQEGAASLWNSIVDSSGGALFFCRLCGSPLDAVAPRRVCGVCCFTEQAAFQAREVDESDPSALQGEAAVQELAVKAIVASPNWIDALKNLIYFFMSNGRGFEGLGPDAARAEDLLSAHGLSLPEPWLHSMIKIACEEMEHRHHPFRCACYAILRSAVLQCCAIAAAGFLFLSITYSDQFCACACAYLMCARVRFFVSAWLPGCLSTICSKELYDDHQNAEAEYHIADDI